MAPSGSISANSPRDVSLLPFLGPKLRKLAQDGFLIAIVSNQGGIASGAVKLSDADAALRYTIELARRQGGEIQYYDFAEKPDENRKPGIGMATRLENVLKATYGPSASIDKSASLMVGDSAYQRPGHGYAGDVRPDGKMGTHFSNCDRLFAANYGVSFYEPADFFGWRGLGVDLFDNQKQLDQFLRDYIAPLVPSLPTISALPLPLAAPSSH